MISKIALSYLGQREELGNVFKAGTPLGDKLHAAGQQDGMAWCALFCEVCAKEAYPEKFDEFDKLFSASAVKTWEQFKKAGYATTTIPDVGDVVIWQRYVDGKADWRGHAGIVSRVVGENVFFSVEGNTNSGGSREGVEVAERKHFYDNEAYKVKTGLRLLGFIKLV